MFHKKDVITSYSIHYTKLYELLLRADNADERLTEIGYNIGCVGQERYDFYKQKESAIKQARGLAKSLNISPSKLRDHGVQVKQDGVYRSVYDMFAYPNITREKLFSIWPALSSIDPFIIERIETEAKYAGYIEKQET